MSDNTETIPGMVVRNTQADNSHLMIGHDHCIGLQEGGLGDHSTQASGGLVIAGNP